MVLPTWTWNLKSHCEIKRIQKDLKHVKTTTVEQQSEMQEVFGIVKSS